MSMVQYGRIVIYYAQMQNLYIWSNVNHKFIGHASFFILMVKKKEAMIGIYGEVRYVYYLLIFYTLK